MTRSTVHDLQAVLSAESHDVADAEEFLARLDERTPARRRLALPIIATVVAILVIVVGVTYAYYSPKKHASAPPASGSAPTGRQLIGYRWNATEVVHDGVTTPVPSSYGVWVEFGPTGFVSYDGVNTTNGMFIARPSGLSIAAGATSLVGRAGPRTGRDTVSDAMTAIFGGEQIDSAALTGTTLALSSNGTSVTFERGGPPNATNSGDATISGTVTLSGGVCCGGGHPGVGQVYAYTDATLSSPPVLSADLDKSGAFTLNIAAGTYYLTTTAATYNDAPCTNHEPVKVAAGESVRADITCQIK